MNKFSLLSFSLLILILSGCSEEDRYLSSIRRVPVQELSPSCEQALDQYDLKEPSFIYKSGENFILADHFSKYCVDVINISSGSKTGLFRKGRGPKEALVPYITVYNGNLILYDISNVTCVRLNLDSSLRDGFPCVDTLFVLPRGLDMPTSIQLYDGGFIAAYPVNKDIWYASRGFDGACRSTVSAPAYPELKRMSDDLYWSFLLSTHYAVNPDESAVCAAMVNSPTLSFSRIENGNLKEVKRYQEAAPEFSEDGETFSSNSRRAFSRPVGYGDKVYVLYSGQPLKGSDDGYPPYECKHLIEYAWDGNPVRHFVLSEPISAFCIEGDMLFALSNYPETRILQYSLNHKRRN